MLGFAGFEEQKALIDMNEEFHSQISFPGNKILKTGTDADKAWYNSLAALMLAIKTFVQ